MQTPEAEIDLAKAKLTIDKLIDPSIDVPSVLAQLDSMANALRALLPPQPSKRLTLDALRYHVYTASPWNGNRPFQYDLADPLGKIVRNKLLTTYLSTRKGNCVSMPVLFVILGQKLGVDMTVAAAPNHLFVKYRDDQGAYFNLETTSGAGFTRDVWLRKQFPMTDEAIASGIYMRPLSKKETVAVLVGTLLEYLTGQKQPDQVIAIAKLVREYAPKDVSLILNEHNAYVTKLREGFVAKYPTPNDIPLERRPAYLEYEGRLKALYSEAYALGWRPLPSDSDGRSGRSIPPAQLIQ